MSEAPSSMVDRVVLILSVFERSSEALTAGQVSVRSGIPRSSVQRILQQLVGARWLKRYDDGYALGLRMFEEQFAVVRPLQRFPQHRLNGRLVGIEEGKKVGVHGRLRRLLNTGLM